MQHAAAISLPAMCVWSTGAADSIERVKEEERKVFFSFFLFLTRMTVVASRRISLDLELCKNKRETAKYPRKRGRAKREMRRIIYLIYKKSVFHIFLSLVINRKSRFILRRKCLS